MAATFTTLIRRRAGVPDIEVQGALQDTRAYLALGADVAQGDKLIEGEWAAEVAGRVYPVGDTHLEAKLRPERTRV